MRISHPIIEAYIDSQEKNKGNGWAFHKDFGCRPVRSIVTDSTGNISYNDLPRTPRTDVDDFFNGGGLYINSGWEYEYPDIVKIELEMNINNEWINFYSYELSSLNNVLKMCENGQKKIPSYLVVDNFFENPNLYRDFALKQLFGKSTGSAGYRTSYVFRPDSLKQRFEQLLGKKIINWENYCVNGCFQYCNKNDQIVYHCDTQEYAGIIYLTPNAPPDAGTSLYRSKVNGLMKIEGAKSEKSIPALYDETFAKGFFDASQFDLVDKIGNVYNRLVLWDGQIIHAASDYFGDDINNSRLFQIFFFDLEK